MYILLASIFEDKSRLRDSLIQKGYGCDLALPFAETAAIAQHSGPYDVILLEVDEIRLQALAILRDIRRRGVQAPVLVLGTAPTHDEEVAALEFGADDVLRRAVPLALLHARMQAVLRRGCGHASAQLRCGNVVLDHTRRTVAVDDRPVRITCREFDVLEMLMLRRGTLLTKEHFMARSYGAEDGPDQRILDVFVCKLRRKLAAAGSAEIVRTIWGRGYVLEEPTPAALEAARLRYQAAAPRTPRAHPGLGASGGLAMAVA
ncbi:response regulator transcription factor [Roseomonas sp. M0104]|uniref:Response regulator transcription factor n=1 Tax=Teichococcus coralli TaxID=2545983 RepID=A0A845BC16_9PROT|nr:response regulator transcription factor [Pseudoroseomonas coralli]MXP62882.1 response regulator transcription factor [Pseudoroseomonas coralli]